jgi:hypothetical protein
MIKINKELNNNLKELGNKFKELNEHFKNKHYF